MDSIMDEQNETGRKHRKPIANSRGIANSALGSKHRSTGDRERNVTSHYSETIPGNQFNFTGAPIAGTGVTDKAFQMGINEVVEKYKQLKAEGRNPLIDIEGQATGSIHPGKGVSYYENERANAFMEQLIAKGVDPKYIRTNVHYDPKPDPRSTTSEQKALNRGAKVTITPLGGEPDNPDLGPHTSFMKLSAAIVKTGFGQLLQESRFRPTPFDMHDRFGRIGRIAATLQHVFTFPFDWMHKQKLITAGLSPKGNNSSNGSAKNAFRHTLWSALGTRYLGPEMTGAANQLHDSVDVSDNIKPGQQFRGKNGNEVLARVDTAADVYNNRIGIRIGKAHMGASPEEIAFAVLLEMYEQGLWIAETIDNKGNVQNPDFLITLNQRKLSFPELMELHELIKQKLSPDNVTDPEAAYIQKQIDSLQLIDKLSRK